MNLGQNATFMCYVGSAPFASWKINGTPLYNLTATVRDDVTVHPVGENRTYSLTILAKQEYNMIKVQCVATSKSERVDSEAAHLIIG